MNRKRRRNGSPEHTVEYLFCGGVPGIVIADRIKHYEKKIHIKTFSIRLTLAQTAEYPEGCSRNRHLLLDYATDEILLSGKRINAQAFAA
jgi:hypothetical protein